MKKILIALLASTAVGGVVSAQSFPDVPAGHYAEEAVARLADLGILIGFPDGTYNGDKPFNRYEAALVISRLLDTVEGEMLTDADLDTIRNAIQELSSNAAANEQAIADLQAAASTPGADAAAVQDMQTQLDKLTVELDTVTAAQEALKGLEQQVLDNSDQVAQLNDLVKVINDDVSALQAAQATGGNTQAGEALAATSQKNADDIANLREYVVLLRRNQVDLDSRVAAVESSDEAQNGRLDDLDKRLVTLEEAAVAFNGEIGLNYKVMRLSGEGVPFDTDRIWGIGQERELEPSAFSSGTDDVNEDGDETDVSEVAEDRQDIENKKGEFSPDLTLNVNFSQAKGLTTEAGLNSFDASVALTLEKATVLDADTDVEDPDFDPLNNDNYFDGYVFKFNSFEATLGPIGAEPITFYYGQNPGAEFTPYVFESLGPGFRVDIGTPEFLAFLQPTVQIAYGVYDYGGDDKDDTYELPDDDAEMLAEGADDTEGVANPWHDAYYRGIHATITPFSGDNFAATIGGSYAQIAGFAADNADAANDGAGNNVDITVSGVNGDVSLSLLDVTFEYANSARGAGVLFQDEDTILENDDGEPVGFDGAVLDDDATSVPVVFDGAGNSNLFYAEATLDTAAAGIPLLENVKANYRNIPVDWYGLKYDEDTYPWDRDQEGYGVSATAGLSIFRLTGFYDHYTIAEDATEPAPTGTGSVTGNTVDAMGVEFGAELVRAIEVYGFYNNITLNSQQVQLLDSADRNNDYVNGLGVGVRHDGEAENALVPGLNFDVAYSFTTNQIAAASLDSEAKVGGFTISPYVDYSVNVNNLPESEDDRTLKAGGSIVSDPIDMILAPSFAANVNYRNTDNSDLEDGAEDYNTNVLQYSVGLNFNKFLLDNSSLGVRYGSYTGHNIQLDPNVNGADDSASDISDGDVNNGATQQTTGYEIVWNYYGAAFSYGAYTSDTDTNVEGGATGGQAFSVSYTVNF